MPSADPFTVKLDGRVLNGWTIGPSGGPVLLYQPGTPEPPVPWPHLESLAMEAGLRLVYYARPGYSGSTRHEGRSVADVASDVEFILDHLGVTEFMTLGHSGGGPHTIACAALLPARCRAAATMGAVAPHDIFDGEWMAGMAAENLAEFEVVVERPESLAEYLAAELDALAGVSGDDVAGAFGDLVSDVDREALSGDFAEFMAACLRRAARDGLYGWVDDDLAFARPWGFALDEVETPVAIWQGRHDRMVPFEHGVWLVDHMPTAIPRLLDDEGHVSLMTTRLGEIVSELCDSYADRV